MSKMKTEFELIAFNDGNPIEGTGSKISITAKGTPNISIKVTNGFEALRMKSIDLERFAINILKSIGSKRLKK